MCFGAQAAAKEDPEAKALREANLRRQEEEKTRLKEDQLEDTLRNNKRKAGSRTLLSAGKASGHGTNFYR